MIANLLFILARAAEDESLAELLDDELEDERELDPLLLLLEELEPLDDFDELLEELQHKRCRINKLCENHTKVVVSFSPARTSSTR